MSDAGWMVITSNPACMDDWQPGEAIVSPQIRYSTNTTVNGLYVYGSMSDATQNNIADTMVIYVNAANTSNFGTIFTNTESNYTSVYLKYDSYTFYQAKDYCMREYGTSLASVHSSTDETNLMNSRYDLSVKILAGLNDIKSESTRFDQTIASSWQWTDGTDYDYAVNWNSGEPNQAGNEDCIEYFSTGLVNDFPCINAREQFTCNSYQNWRPIFKISTGNNSYINSSNTNITNSYQYWLNGISSFDTYNEDINFVLNEFDVSGNDNYRSLVIDDWYTFADNAKFDRIKISLYQNSTEVIYFVFYVTTDIESWFSQGNLVDSTYGDAIYQSHAVWNISGKLLCVCFFWFRFCKVGIVRVDFGLKIIFPFTV